MRSLLVGHNIFNLWPLLIGSRLTLILTPFLKLSYSYLILYLVVTQWVWMILPLLTKSFMPYKSSPSGPDHLSADFWPHCFQL